jgi:hypothetical protein
MYAVIAVFNSLSVRGRSRYTADFAAPHRLKSGNFSANWSCTKSVMSKNLIKQLHTLPVLHFNHCLITEYSETTAHFNGNFDTDNQIYVL